MNWDAVGAFGEIVGAAAVVISLVYLATQIRASNLATKQEATREVQNLLAQILAQLGSSTELSTIWVKGNMDAKDLDTYQIFQYRSMMTQVISLFERMYRLEMEGGLDSWIWTGNLKIFLVVVGSPGFKSWFNDRKFVLNEDWAEFLEQELAQITDEYKPQGIKVDAE
jgi:hypothetical protein